jgi:hypothetical protein
MFQFLFEKEQQVQRLIDRYLDTLKMARENFQEAMNVYFGKGSCGDFELMIERTDKAEGNADEIRNEIENLMYSKALIPESRGDILGLLEAIDQILSLFKLILYMIHTQDLTIPEFLVLDVKELIRISLECCDLLIKQVEALFRKSEGIRALAFTIDNNESHCDHIERRIIKKIFASNLDSFQKLQLKDMVIQMGGDFGSSRPGVSTG